MKYGSVCSGIEAATAAWHSLGWEPAFFSEIEAFPRAVLAHHYPQVPLHGDFTTIGAEEYGSIDLLVGGTPCQSFSIAGLRKGLDDDRGNLALEFIKLAQRTRPRWVVWENVPGVLSSNGGRDFGTFLTALGEIGYGFAYRVLDAQYFGVAQRRRRVFVVGCLGNWRSAAAVLFERESMSGNPAPSREKGKATTEWPADCAPTLNAAFGNKLGLENQHIGGGLDCLSIAQCLTTGTGQRYDPETETLIPMRGGGFDEVIGFDAYNNDITGNLSKTIDTGQDYHHVPNIFTFAHQQGGSIDMRTDYDRALTLQRSQTQAVCFDLRGREGGSQFEGPHDTANIRAASGGSSRSYVAEHAVRRLTPRECERLQGFSDDFTAIPWRNKQANECPDGPRYKALGNSMAVPVMRWIGERIQMVEDLGA